MCINNTRALGLGETVNYFFSRYNNHYGGYGIDRVTYLIRSKNVLINEYGSLVWEHSCVFQGYEACTTRFKHHLNNIFQCQEYLQKHKIAWSDMINIITSNNPSKILTSTTRNPLDVIKTCSYNNTYIKSYKTVFTISAALDFNFHHFIADSLSRLARYIPFLQKNKDIMIHIQDAQTKYKRKGKSIVKLFLIIQYTSIYYYYMGKIKA